LFLHVVAVRRVIDSKTSEAFSMEVFFFVVLLSFLRYTMFLVAILSMLLYISYCGLVHAIKL
jgi:uncharacterized membrane protein YhaH (DUF805 family)